MPVSNAIEDWRGRRLRQTAKGWTAERKFTVRGATSETESLSAPGLPNINDQHPQNSRLKVDGRDPSTPEGPGLWEVLITYSIPEFGDSHQNEDDPLSMVPEIQWELTITSEQVDRDIRQNPIVNSARIPFDQKTTREIYEWSVTITRNEPFFDWGLARRFQNKVNSEQIELLGGYLLEPGTVKVAKIIPAEKFLADAEYVKMTYTLQFREYPSNLPSGFGPKTWTKSPFQHWVIDQSFAAYYNDGGTKKRAKFIEGPTTERSVVSDPVLLIGDGTPLDTSFKLEGENTAVAQPNPFGPYIFRAQVGTTTTGYVLIWLQCEGADLHELNLPGV